MSHHGRHSRERTVRKMCAEKVRYRDEREAKTMKQKAENARGVPLRIYECSFCAGYHLTRVNAEHRENAS